MNSNDKYWLGFWSLVIFFFFMLFGYMTYWTAQENQHVIEMGKQGYIRHYDNFSGRYQWKKAE